MKTTLTRSRKKTDADLSADSESAVKSVASATATDPASAAPPPAVKVSGPPHYDSGVHFDSGTRYADGDPVVIPINNGGVVKLGITNLPDSELRLFAETENQAVTGNAAFTTPVPSLADMTASIDAFGGLLEQLMSARQWVKELTNQKDVARAALEQKLKSRAAYVQATSNGNSALILSVGFALRAAGSPVGVLPPPLGLRVDLNGTVGKMILSWQPVRDARNYLVQCASMVNGLCGEWRLIDVGGKSTLTLNDMTVGTAYVFRVAAGGGRTGISDWSPEVLRTAA